MRKHGAYHSVVYVQRSCSVTSSMYTKRKISEYIYFPDMKFSRLCLREKLRVPNGTIQNGISRVSANSKLIVRKKKKKIEVSSLKVAQFSMLIHIHGFSCFWKHHRLFPHN